MPRDPGRKAPVAKAPGKTKAPKRLRGEALRVQATVVLDRLLKAYPTAHCALDFTNAFQLLCATILSAQCTDKRVNLVSPALFARYPDPAALAAANPEELEEIIRSTGFFRSKAKSLIGMATGLADLHGGEVPAEMDALTALPGVGRKTANVLLGNAFGRNDGIVVDTHVTRVSARLGLTSETDPVKIEQSLMPLFPRDRWTMLSHLLIEHGRQVCVARTPRCGECVLSDVCPSARLWL
jgi:endonuclease-3